MIRGERSLEFFNGQFLYITRNGGSEHFKFLSPAAVVAAFRDAPVDSGWIPPQVVRCGASVGGDFAVLFVPARVHEISLEPITGKRLQTLSIPLPSLIFFGVGKNFRIWATKEPEFTPRAALYHCPTPNVFENGSICWGSNKPPRASAATIAKAWELFIGSPFSDHAANQKTRSHANDVRGLLFSLPGKKNFPARELMPAGGNADQTITRAIAVGGNHGN